MLRWRRPKPSPWARCMQWSSQALSDGSAMGRRVLLAEAARSIIDFTCYIFEGTLSGFRCMLSGLRYAPETWNISDVTRAIRNPENIFLCYACARKCMTRDSDCNLRIYNKRFTSSWHLGKGKTPLHFSTNTGGKGCGIWYFWWRVSCQDQRWLTFTRFTLPGCASGWLSLSVLEHGCSTRYRDRSGKVLAW